MYFYNTLKVKNVILYFLRFMDVDFCIMNQKYLKKHESSEILRLFQSYIVICYLYGKKRFEFPNIFA